ncbi:MAG TPA: PRC-barrel domain-containing protein [Trebonia sp.]|jgi:sporulation protein YlmC with PRC-barrel domain
MTQAQLFRLGADVHCADGDCGKLKTLVIDRGDDAVTHLVVEPAHRQGLGKLVPLRLVDTGTADTAKGEIRLRCTMAEFGQLDAAEATYFFQGDENYELYREGTAVWPYYAPSADTLPGAPGTPGDPVIVDTVPDQLPGEDEVSRGEHVHATDGDVGHIQGIVVDTDSGRVTSLLLRERHHLGHKTVLIPRSAVADVGAHGFNLNIARDQVHKLPPADIDHPVG